MESLKKDHKDKQDYQYDKDYKDYAHLFKALGDETRVKIFDMLTEGEQCACMLLEEVAISQSTLSYHMKILCDCGLVTGRRDGIWMRYTINGDTLFRLQEFLNSLRPNKSGTSLRPTCPEGALADGEVQCAGKRA